MLNSYLPKKYHALFVISGAFFVIFVDFYVGAFIFTIYFFILWFFRIITFRRCNFDGVCAPFAGKVFHIKNNVKHPCRDLLCQEVMIQRSICGGFGLYFPIDSEVDEILEMENGNWIITFLTNTKQIISVMLIVPPTLSLWISSGDKGKRGAIWGLIPWGANYSILLPVDFNFQLHIGSRLIGGETIICKQ